MLRPPPVCHFIDKILALCQLIVQQKPERIHNHHRDYVKFGRFGSGKIAQMHPAAKHIAGEKLDRKLPLPGGDENVRSSI